MTATATATRWVSPSELAAEFGIHPKTIRRMVLRGNYRPGSVAHVGPQIRLDYDAWVSSFINK